MAADEFQLRATRIPSSMIYGNKCFLLVPLWPFAGHGYWPMIVRWTMRWGWPQNYEHLASISATLWLASSSGFITRGDPVRAWNASNAVLYALVDGQSFHSLLLLLEQKAKRELSWVINLLEQQVTFIRNSWFNVCGAVLFNQQEEEEKEEDSFSLPPL